MTNDFNDWCQLKYMEALPLLRIITGSKEKEAVDRVWQDVTLKSIGPDGLFYIPLTGARGADSASPGRQRRRPSGWLFDRFQRPDGQAVHAPLCVWP